MGLFDYPTDTGKEAGDAGVTFLDGLGEQDWKKILSLVETRQFRAGENLIRAGDEDDSFFILSSGSVEVIITDNKGAERQLAVIHEGAVFGEIAFFDHGARTATIRAREKGTAVRFTRKNFEHLAAWEPMLARRILFDLGKTLAVRLRWLTKRI